MARAVPEHRWREAQRHELDFWKRWRELPAYQGLDLERYWAGELTKFCVEPDFFSGRRVLDVGCGPVGLIHFVPQAAARIRLDPLLPEYAERLPLPEPRLSVAAAGERLPLAPDCVDICVCFNALDHMRDPHAALAEMARVLRPGGHLLLMVHSFPAWALPLLWPDRLHPHHWTHARVVEMLAGQFHGIRAVRERRRFDLPLGALLKPSGWKYAAGNLVLYSSYFLAIAR